MRRVPILATLIVGLAVAGMIGLGLWQLLDRAPKKQAYLAQLAANPAKPPIAFPRFPDESLLFRRAGGYCLEPVSFAIEGAGSASFRVIAACRTGAEGPGMSVQLGTTRDPGFKPSWKGGKVSGFISHAPSHQSLIGSLFSAEPKILMLVADTPAPGLSPNGAPDISTIPNNHLSYAVQWFLFAGIALVIYILALRRRWAGLGSQPPHG
jgi:surfeit locus 1 family protein